MKYYKLYSFLLSTCLSVIVGFTLLFLFEKAPVVYKNIPFPTEKKDYKIGETVYTRVQVCATKVVEYTFVQKYKSVDNGAVYYIDKSPIVTESKLGCNTFPSVPKKMPEGVFPGKWIIEGKTTIKGTFRNHEITWSSEEFTITP